MAHYNLALLGFGNVGRAFAHLLLRKRDELQSQFNMTFTVTGISTGRHGMAIDLDGIDLERALALVEGVNAGTHSGNGNSRSLLNRISARSIPESAGSTYFIQNCGADVLFENTPVNYKTGQPAVDHLRLALEQGMYAITANKGPVVHACRALTVLAQSKGLKFYFESAVMDGAPIFSLFRSCLPAARLKSFRGVLNSTTNLILTRMEAGESFDQAVAYAQSIGIAETDPSGDVDGWDSAVKVAALSTVLMDTPLIPEQVEREGIRGIQPGDIERARAEGKRWKLICSAQKTNGSVQARVAPEMVAADSPLYSISGTTSMVQFETDVLGLLSVVETDPSPDTTAYGLLADFINAVNS